MITFFKKNSVTYYAVRHSSELSSHDIDKLIWLLEAHPVATDKVTGTFIGPRREMVSPWSTNAVEITQNMEVGGGIDRIEQYDRQTALHAPHDPMLQNVYRGLDQQCMSTDAVAAPIVHITDIREYNEKEGLALSDEEIAYLENLSQRLQRPLTDSEVFGFSQVNSEHCRHKIFNGTFVIDGQEMPQSLFQLIKTTSKTNPNGLVSAYKDNVAFVEGPTIEQFAPTRGDVPSEFTVREVPVVLSLKAETHNFPTTVEPFNGAATGTGGEIRDRLGGGRASLPLAGTAVYMTSYARSDASRRWELCAMPPRRWLYQSPIDILIKASNGASDFGNKFGQPLICGSLLTFENREGRRTTAYDKVIMLAGGVGYAAARDAMKGDPEPDETVVVMGGDNYRIGMGGGAVSSVNTGQYAGAIELNAVQRANPEMQKRVANVIRALAEQHDNPIVSIHDHGAGGHLNALSELVESTGGHINVDALPVGDSTLSAKEIIGNESQERMGLLVKPADVPHIERIAQRERAPFYAVGHTTGDHRLVFGQSDGQRPIDLLLSDMFGNSPKTVMTDNTVTEHHSPLHVKVENFNEYLENVLQMEAVACKDWLTNKVDRSVTGRIAHQQCQGVLQLPLSDCGVVALDYTGTAGIATSIGHAPQAGLLDASAGSTLAIAEALTNIVGAKLTHGLRGVSLSANWMWPCRNPGQDARLYQAVKACSEWACQLGINIPTGKDSLSMTQRYGNQLVMAPGTVIISAAAEVSDVKKTVGPVLQRSTSQIYYIDFSDGDLQLGGSALAQSLGHLGSQPPRPLAADDFRHTFDMVQQLVGDDILLAIHDVSAGGLITTLLEMAFANTRRGLDINLDAFGTTNFINILFAENPAVVIQVANTKCRKMERLLKKNGIRYFHIGHVQHKRSMVLTHQGVTRTLDIDHLRDVWYRSSYLLDSHQSGEAHAAMRYANYKKQPLNIRMGQAEVAAVQGLKPLTHHAPSGIRAAIIREKGVNGDREMAYSLYAAGFDVVDVHTTDLMTGRATLDDVNMIVFCGGFSNSDVLGSARGWASAFVWNDKAREALQRFYARPDTLSLGICNGCQLMMELGLLEREPKPGALRMQHNDSHKFESQYLTVVIPENNSVMLSHLSGSRLGIWVAHGEGKFAELPSELTVVARYAYHTYPGNPNGSPDDVAGVVSADGCHLAMMPHLERAIMPWQCGWYPPAHANDEATPWLSAFVKAREWIEGRSINK